MSENYPDHIPQDASEHTYGIVASRFNSEHVEALLEKVIEILKGSGVSDEGIEIIRVPGANEIPYVASMLAKEGDFNCLICLGLVLAGDTSHHDVIAYTSAQSLQQIAHDFDVPIINGIVVVNSEAQAVERCSGKLNRGREFALAAIEMASLNQLLMTRRNFLGGNEFDNIDDLIDMDWEDDQDLEGEEWKL